MNYLTVNNYDIIIVVNAHYRYTFVSVVVIIEESLDSFSSLPDRLTLNDRNQTRFCVRHLFSRIMSSLLYRIAEGRFVRRVRPDQLCVVNSAAKAD